MSTCIIEDLQRRPFNSRSLKEKEELIRNGQPTPRLPNLRSEIVDRSRQYVRKFAVAHYTRYPWLTGCVDQSKLFCWPCLLFSDDKTVWVKNGFNNLKNLFQASDKHDKSKKHIASYFAMQTFGETGCGGDIQLDDHRELERILEHNDQVKKNRYVLKCAINCVNFLVQQDLAFQGDGMNYAELLNFVSLFDGTLRSHLKAESPLEATSVGMRNDIITSMGSVLRDLIRDEIAEAKFVSILLNETLDSLKRPKLSLCFRFIGEKGVQERFVKMVDANQTVEALFQAVDKEICDFDVSSKLTGQFRPRAGMMSSAVAGLMVKIREKYPQAFLLQDPKIMKIKSLLDPLQFHLMKHVFPNIEFSYLEAYKKFFDKDRLKQELCLLYTLSHSEIYSKTAHPMYRYMTEKKLNLAMPETYNLLMLILTNWRTVRDPGSNQRIETLVKSRHDHEALGGLVLLYLEKPLLRRLALDPKQKFVDMVADKFCLETGRPEFVFKNRLASQTPKIGDVHSVPKDPSATNITPQRTPKAAVPPAESLARSHLEPEVVIKEEPVDYDEGSSSSLAYNPGTLKVEFILPNDEGEWPSHDAPSTSKSTPSTSKAPPLTSVLEFTVEKDSEDDNIIAYTQQLVAATNSRKKKGTPATDVVADIDEKRKCDNKAGETSVVLDKDSKLASEEKKSKDEFDAFGEYIAMELRQMDWKTRATLQKAIGDLVFEAKMGKLKDQAASSETVPN